MNKLGLLTLPFVFMTTTQVNAQPIDIIELYNEKDGLQKTLEIQDYDSLEDLLKDIADEIGDLDSDDSDSNDNGDSNNGGGSSSSSSNSNSNDNSDFQNTMEAANTAFQNEMEKFDSEAQPQQETNVNCQDNQVLNPDTGACETPAQPPTTAAVAPLTGSAAASAAVIPSIPILPIEDMEIIPPPQEEQPQEPESEGDDNEN